MSRRILFIAISCITSVVYGQSPASVWYFGQNAGVDFTSGSPVAIADGQLNTEEGCVTISDENGLLLFYTNGVSVWNKGHKVMPTGSGLLGSPSSTFIRRCD